MINTTVFLARKSNMHSDELGHDTELKKNDLSGLHELAADQGRLLLA